MFKEKDIKGRLEGIMSNSLKRCTSSGPKIMATYIVTDMFFDTLCICCELIIFEIATLKYDVPLMMINCIK